MPSIIPLLQSQFSQRGVMQWDATKPNYDFSIVSGKNFFGNLNNNKTEKAFYVKLIYIFLKIIYTFIF